MALPKRRTPKAKQGQRRSHHSLKPPHLVRCKACNAWHISHYVCEACEGADDSGDGGRAEAEAE